MDVGSSSSPAYKLIMLKKWFTVASFPVFLAIARFFPWHRIPSPCMFYRVTGLPCPSCGMTRSAIALTYLHFVEAWKFNPLGVLFVVLFGLWWVYASYEALTGKSTRQLAWVRKRVNMLALVSLIIFFAYGVTRIAAFLCFG